MHEIAGKVIIEIEFIDIVFIHFPGLRKITESKALTSYRINKDRGVFSGRSTAR